MKIFCAFLVIILGAVSTGGSLHFPASKEERQSTIDALTASYDAMDKGLLDSAGKVIVIKKVDDKIVVSFLNYEHENVYGGQAHVTYDPVAKKVVMVEAED